MRPKAAPGTFAIYGKDGTFISLDFGAGRLAREISLYDYLCSTTRAGTCGLYKTKKRPISKWGAF